MQSKSDAQLLREYAERGAEAAFTELVHRHTDLVYSAALRQVQVPDVAAEVTQKVFTSLARGVRNLAPQLAPEASLAGWLCRSARNLSLNHRRDEFRRRTRERHAMEQLVSTPADAPDWEKLRPVLDDAMSELSEQDYDALVLRFYQNQDFRAVGAAIGVSDDTAQKRVTRALDKLRDLLAQRGIRTTAGALGIAITANAVQAAPVGLAVTISTAALAGTAATTSTLIAATIKTIAMTTLQKTLIAATVAVLAGAGIYEARQAAQLRHQVQTLQTQQAPFEEQIQQLRSEFADATNRLGDLLAENSRLKSNSNEQELLKLRAQVTAASRNAANVAAKTQNLRNSAPLQTEEDSQRNQTRANLETFFKLTNLSPEKADQYVSLEVEMKQRQDERLKALLSGTLSVAEAVRQRDQDKQTQDDQRRALLGPAGSATLQSIADGMRDGVAKRLTSAVQASMRNNPLTQEQSDRLQSAIKAEVAANTMDDTDLFRPEEEWTQMVTDRQQHVVQAASGFLTPEQHQQFQFLVGENIKQMLQQRDQRRKALGINQ